MSPRSKMDHGLPWPPTLTSLRPSPVTPAACLWPGSWGRLRAQAWSAFPRGQLASLKLCFFLLLGPGAPGAGRVSLGMSPGQYGPGVSSQQRASWAQAAHTAPGLPNGDVCLGCGITRLPSTAPRVVAATARVPRPRRGSPAQLPLAFASGLCRLPPSSPPR